MPRNPKQRISDQQYQGICARNAISEAKPFQSPFLNKTPTKCPSRMQGFRSLKICEELDVAGMESIVSWTCFCFAIRRAPLRVRARTARCAPSFIRMQDSRIAYPVLWQGHQLDHTQCLHEEKILVRSSRLRAVNVLPRRCFSRFRWLLISQISSVRKGFLRGLRLLPVTSCWVSLSVWWMCLFKPSTWLWMSHFQDGVRYLLSWDRIRSLFLMECRGHVLCDCLRISGMTVAVHLRDAPTGWWSKSPLPSSTSYSTVE